MWESENHVDFFKWIHDPPEQAQWRCREFWEKNSKQAFVQDLGLESFDRVIPMCWHTDGIKIYKTHKAWCYSFASQIRKGPSVDTKRLLLCIRDGDCVKPYTHDDIALAIAYAMDVLRTGLYPSCDHNGQPFPPNSREGRKAGTPFAGGWRACFSAFKADLEARVLVHKLVRNWSSDSICEHCLASKYLELTFGDFSDKAAYLGWFISHEDFLKLNPPDRQSAWINVRGWRKERNLEDMLHCLHQGIAPVAIASLVCDHFESTNARLTLSKLSECLSSEAWGHYRSWKRGKQAVVAPTSSKFSAPRFGRDAWNVYPELASVYKGAMCKYLIFWCASFLKDKFEEHGSEDAATRAYCAWCLAEFQFLQETSGPWLSVDVSERMYYAGRTFLLYYQQLAGNARKRFAETGRRQYKILPKFHSFLHQVLDLKSTRRNLRYDHLYMDEDFMKQVAKIASFTHPRTLDKVTMYRYRAFLEFFL